MKKIITILGLSLSLHGCFVAGAAAGAAAIAVVYDHRSFENSIEDTKLANKIALEIRRHKELRDECHIEVTTFSNVVLLTGETPNPAWREQAEEIARATPGVDKVYNQLTVQGVTSSLTRTSDSWITTKVKSEMLATDDLKSSSIKVLTENGTVYLMGNVSPQQASIAVDIAREVSGVQRVVKMFKYKKPTI